MIGANSTAAAGTVDFETPVVAEEIAHAHFDDRKMRIRWVGDRDRDRGAGVRLGLRDADNVNGFQLQFRFPLRAFISLMLLAFRVLLLMYFFSPARKP